MIRGRKRVVTIITLVCGLGIALFIFSRTHAYLVGPQVTGTTLDPITYLGSYSITYEAHIKNTTSASINGHSLPIQNDGVIQYVLALAPGTNQVELSLQDEFGKEKIYHYTLITPYQNNIVVDPILDEVNLDDVDNNGDQAEKDEITDDEVNQNDPSLPEEVDELPLPEDR